MSRILAALFLLSTAARADAEVQALLRRADAYRLTAGASRVESSVESYKSGALDKERRYVVYLKSNRRSLVLSRSPIESGQKFLMLGDDFWLVLPASQRPIRISPMQK